MKKLILSSVRKIAVFFITPKYFFKYKMLIYSFLGLSLVVLGAHKAYVYSDVYYVDQRNPLSSDSNAGTEELPWKTIQHAVNVIEPGTIIQVSAGNYGRTIIERSGTDSQTGLITITAENKPIIQFSDTNAMMLNPDEVAVTKGFIVRGDYIKISGFEITNIGEGEKGGVYFDGVHDIELSENFIHELSCTYGNWGAIRGNHSRVLNKITIRDNVMWRVEGITISPPLLSQNWLIEGNDISHGTDLTPDGVKVSGDADAVRLFGHGHVVRNNYIHDFLRSEGTQGSSAPHMDCFQTYSVNGEVAYDIVVEGNLVENIGAQFVMFEDHDSENNVHHISFINNIFTNGHGTIAVNIRACDYLVFVHNLVAYSGRGLRLLDGSHNATVYNNIFYYNDGDARLVDDDLSKPGTEWDYNVHYPFLRIPVGYEYDENALITIDPLLSDPQSGDFHLLENSPAIDAGKQLINIVTDKDGIPRPQGPDWDIGPYEYHGDIVFSPPQAPQNLRIINN